MPEIEMYHYKARIYSPQLGRFLQTDPVGYDDQINLSAYVGNDPLNRVDPTGREEEEITVTWRPPLIINYFIPGTPEHRASAEEFARRTERAFQNFGDWVCSHLCNASENSTAEKPYSGETPDDKPDDFESLGQQGKKAPPKRKKSDGSVWEPDRGARGTTHGGSKWKRWPSVRDWERDRGRESVRPDGSVR